MSDQKRRNDETPKPPQDREVENGFDFSAFRVFDLPSRSPDVTRTVMGRLGFMRVGEKVVRRHRLRRWGCRAGLTLAGLLAIPHVRSLRGASARRGLFTPPSLVALLRPAAWQSQTPHSLTHWSSRPAHRSSPVGVRGLGAWGLLTPAIGSSSPGWRRCVGHGVCGDVGADIGGRKRRSVEWRVRLRFGTQRCGLRSCRRQIRRGGLGAGGLGFRAWGRSRGRARRGRQRRGGRGADRRGMDWR